MSFKFNDTYIESGNILAISVGHSFQNNCLGKITYNVPVLCVCGGLVALTVSIALKPNIITAVDFSTSAAITQNTCYAQCFLISKL